MLEKLFLQVLNMSITSGFVILIVILTRFLLRKAPRIISYALWAVVLFRLVCPFSFESAFSLLPLKANPIPQEIVYQQSPRIDSGIRMLDDAVNSSLPAATPYASVNPLQIWTAAGTALWLFGIAALLLYSVISLILLNRTLRGAAYQGENLYISGNLALPFVMGVFRPKIYLPAHLTGEEKQYILLHERTHIKRLDPLFKIVGFAVLCLHWFNPLVWAAFFLCGNDMEMSCDEAVIQKLGGDVKKGYSSSLLALATGRRIVGGTPLAFGEGNIKTRIQNVLRYRKPALWVLAVSVLVAGTAGAGLLANPKNPEQDLSFLNPENLTAVAMQRTEPIRVTEYPSGGYQFLDGQSIGKWLDTAVWKHRTETALEPASPTYGIENIHGEDVQSEILLYKDHPPLAKVVYDGEFRFYETDRASYENFEALLFPSEDESPTVDPRESGETIAVPAEGQDHLTFWVKPDEPPEVIGNVAANIWLQSLSGSEVPDTERISSFTIGEITVISGSPMAGETFQDMKYHYVVQLGYSVTTDSDVYFSPSDGISGKGTFHNLFRELCVKVLDNGSFEIVSVGTGGGEQEFLPG